MNGSEEANRAGGPVANGLGRLAGGGERAHQAEKMKQTGDEDIKVILKDR